MKVNPYPSPKKKSNSVERKLADFTITSIELVTLFNLGAMAFSVIWHQSLANNLEAWMNSRSLMFVELATIAASFFLSLVMFLSSIRFLYLGKLILGVRSLCFSCLSALAAVWAMWYDSSALIYAT